MNEKLQDIADVLYDPNEEFQLPLDEVYGQTEYWCGCNVVSHSAKQSILERCFEAIESAKSGNNVIFLSSSIFGGTGAAGFPSIARVIRRMAEQEGLSQNIQIGGCLMLPIFLFKPPEEEEVLLDTQTVLLNNQKERWIIIIEFLG